MWKVRSVLSMLDDSVQQEFSERFAKTIEDYSQFVHKLPHGQLDHLVDHRVNETTGILDNIRLLSYRIAKVEEHSEKYHGFFSSLAEMLTNNSSTLEHNLVSAKNLSKFSKPVYKQVLLWLMASLTTNSLSMTKELEENMKKFEKMNKSGAVIEWLMEPIDSAIATVKELVKQHKWNESVARTYLEEKFNQLTERDIESVLSTVFVKSASIDYAEKTLESGRKLVDELEQSNSEVRELSKELGDK